MDVRTFAEHVLDPLAEIVMMPGLRALERTRAIHRAETSVHSDGTADRAR
jgi:hypothetical protein